MSEPQPWFKTIALSCVVAGALGEVWSFAAAQPPGTVFYLAGWPAAVERFALSALVLGALTWELAPREERASRVMAVMLSAGAALWLGGLALSAVFDLRGTQLGDPRAAAGAISAARVAGGALLLGSLGLRLRR